MRREKWRKAACDTHQRVPSRLWEDSPEGLILLWVGTGSPESSLHWAGTPFFPVHLSAGLCCPVSISLGDHVFFLLFYKK